MHSGKYPVGRSAEIAGAMAHRSRMPMHSRHAPRWEWRAPAARRSLRALRRTETEAVPKRLSIRHRNLGLQ
eukprot:1474886-Lingulodinium_polyedra.AAC.1